MAATHAHMWNGCDVLSRSNKEESRLLQCKPTHRNPAAPPSSALTRINLLLDGHEIWIGEDLLQAAAVDHVGMRAEEGACPTEGRGARQQRAVVAVVPQHHDVPVVCMMAEGQQGARWGDAFCAQAAWRDER